MRRKLILFFCIMTGLAWVMAFNEAAEKPKLLAAHLEQAADYERQGIYVDAVTEYEAALEFAPGDSDIMYRMAKAYLEIGNSKKYISLCKEIIEAYPEKAEVLDELMTYYLEKRDKSAAAKYAAQLAESQPENECVRKWYIELKGSYKEIFFAYTEVNAGYHDTMVVSAEDKETGEVRYGVTDALGGEILPAEYEAAQPFSDDGFSLVIKDGRSIYVDKDGNTRKVPDAETYSSFGMISNERAAACQDGKYGLLDGRMKPKTEFIYEDITLPCDNLAAAMLNGRWALIDRNGKEITEFIYDDVIRDEYGIATRQKRIFVKEGGGYHIINGKGESVGGLSFENACAFPEEGYAAVCQNDRWGYVDKDGELAVDFQFEAARSFSNGYAAVCMDGKWGFVDETGAVVIEPEFEAVTDLSKSGTAAVKRGEWMLIQLNLFR